MSVAPVNGKKLGDLFGLPRSPAAIFKDPTSKKRSVSSPIQVLPEPAAKGSYYMKYFPDGESVFTPGKPTALTPFTLKQKSSESIATPSSGDRTPPSKNGTPSTAPSTCESSKTAETAEPIKGAVCEEKRVRLGDSRLNSATQEPTTLGAIPEHEALVRTQPTVVTVELAAAAKIFLETYYNEILRGPTPRTMRTHYLESQLYGARHLTTEGKQGCLEAFYRAESNNLREIRVLKARSTRSLLFDEGKGATLLCATMCASDFEMLKTLGKGSFGTVRLVREKASPYDSPAVAREKQKQVYAMKVIRKSEMIRSGQEGHMRAERDFLVSSEGSNWAVPLVASFQDVANLYLVMEYMPGGDFLGLLIRENILDEAVTRFYIAEMILGVEEAHALQYIHRDIKPDNFLISASGHLKISDFGLAFDGHWSHDSKYYSSTRYSLLQNLGIYVAGDEHDQKKDESLGSPGAMVCSSSMMAGLEKHQRLPDDNSREPILQWRNRCGNHIAATSVVGTSQYMAPEVNHEATFGLPSWPPVSRRCQQLLAALVTDKSRRLCSKRYQLKDAAIAEITKIADGGHVSGKDGFGIAAGRSMARQYVFPYDAEDIKAHKFFKGLPWDRLHQMPPPFVPKIRSDDDTQYFDDGIVSEDEESTDVSGEGDDKDNMEACTAIQDSPKENADSIDEALGPFDVTVQMKALGWIATPYDSSRLKVIEAEIGQLIATGLSTSDGEALLRFVEKFGKREKKRPRDRLLRDRKTKRISMELRKRNAFLGYTWRRMSPYAAMPKYNRGVEASLAVMRSSHRGFF
ncbi:hypothetical protein SEUCBS139899_005516 [Sporothrix eucalyptigena]|uniref:non-specific serine/threonine protein kinase n=1 Tax=Sporothrix eucalyptigena TaxID=1812306 RepID=A0ABP0BLS4_9PEZI